MKLEDATKEELIWWIKKHAFELKYELRHFGPDVMFRRYQQFNDKAHSAGERYSKALAEYSALLSPYKGLPISSIPRDVCKKGANLESIILQACKIASMRRPPMTNEEAIAFLEQYINSEVYTEKCISAHEMAITALRSAHAGDSIGYHFPDTTKMVPLTLEQLREMDGKPVWIQHDNPKYNRIWLIWRNSKEDDTITGFEGYGKFWKAYAYPPAHIDREEWVSVEERLPEDEKDGETVLVIVFGKPHENITLHGTIMTAGYFRDEGWVLNEYPEWEGPEVTHWMPLPSPPAELEKRMGVRG